MSRSHTRRRTPNRLRMRREVRRAKKWTGANYELVLLNTKTGEESKQGVLVMVHVPEIGSRYPSPYGI